MDMDIGPIIGPTTGLMHITGVIRITAVTRTTIAGPVLV
jgi:hypothetical protein